MRERKKKPGAYPREYKFRIFQPLQRKSKINHDNKIVIIIIKGQEIKNGIRDFFTLCDIFKCFNIGFIVNPHGRLDEKKKKLKE